MAWRGMHSRRGIPAHISDMHMCISRCGKKADPDGLAGLCLEAVEAGQSVLVFCSSKVCVCTPVHMYTYIHVYTYHNISKAKTESCARFLAEFLPADATSLGRSGGGGAACVAGAGAASGDVCDFPPKLDDFPPTRAEERAALLEELARSQAGVDPALQA